jgi:4-amino-4-deoxy-L-arabinose transferase-like glycosyltransferase
MSSQSGLKRGWVVGGAALLLLIFATQMIYAVRHQSLTWDEDDHIFAGYMSWMHQDFGINPEHPPLVKYVATLPLLPLNLKTPDLTGAGFKHDIEAGGFKLVAYLGGRAFLFGNGPQYSVNTLVFRVRMAAMTFALLEALLVFFAAREMFGDVAGLLAMTLLVFEPNIVAHGAYVTTDTGVSCFLFASLYAFYRYVKRPTWGRLALAGLAAGLALGSKHSAVLLLPMLILPAIAVAVLRPEGARDAADSRWKLALKMLGAVAGISLIAIGVLWALYGFRYAARPAGFALNPTLAEYTHPLKPFEARGILFFAHWHLLPESYLYGLTDVRAMADYMPAYIFGKVYAHGVWFYFPAVFVIKSTLGFLGLFGLSLYAIGRGKLRRLEVMFLTLPPAFYFAVAMGSSLNIGARHILPVYVFLCVLLAGAACALMRAGKAWRYAVIALVALHVASSLRAYPNDIAYENELWGGPSQTYKHLSDSNTDWGQQLLAVKQYVDAHGITQCWFGYFVEPMVRFEDYGIPCKPLPTVDSLWAGVQYDVPPRIDGPVFVSAGTLSGFEFGSNVLSPFAVFEKARPVTSIQDGVLVFHGSFDVPLAASLKYVQQSGELLRANQPQQALAAAQTAVGIDPDGMQPQMALGDAAMAAQKPDVARAAYAKALEIAHTMEPSAQEIWIPRVEKGLAVQANAPPAPPSN